MNKNYSTPEQIEALNYKLDFGFVLEKAFDNYKKIAGIAGIGMIISSVIITIFLGGIYGSLYGFANFTQTMTGLATRLTISSQLMIVVGGAIFGGIFSPINAGFIQMARNADVNEDFELSTLFSFFASTYFKDLFISAILISLFGGMINFGFEFIKVTFIGNLFTIFLSFVTILTIPLIIFNDFDAIQAITTSLKLVLKNPFVIIGLLFIAALFCLLGIFGICIGLFFTFPFWYSMIYTIYAQIIPNNSTHELDEIGNMQE